MSKTCSVEGCNGKHCAKGYCRKHYMQINRHGRLTPELENKPNDYVVKGDIVYINICSKGEMYVVSIDLEYYDSVKQYNWNIDNDEYVIGYVEGRMVKLHRFITNCPNDKVVDHIDRNKLNNCKSNLRICDIGDNNKNHPKHKHNKSGYKNIYRVKDKNLWKVSIRANGKEYFKYFNLNDLEQAVAWRNKVLREVHGEYANLND